MPQQFSAREVLAQLNELGYDEISKQQLKDFMQDLKKLLKYERKINQENLDPKKSPSDNIKDPPKRHSDIFTELHEHPTVESYSKACPKRQKIISIQINRLPTVPPCMRVDKSLSASKEVCDKSVSASKVCLDDKTTQCDESVTDMGKANRSSSSASKKRTDRSKSSKKDPKPTTAFIRQPIQRNVKSDPVALYHQYQAEWKRQKIPGESDHADLRWVIREKMLGAPKTSRA